MFWLAWWPQGLLTDPMSRMGLHFQVAPSRSIWGGRGVWWGSRLAGLLLEGLGGGGHCPVSRTQSTPVLVNPRGLGPRMHALTCSPRWPHPVGPCSQDVR